MEPQGHVQKKLFIMSCFQKLQGHIEKKFYVMSH